MVGLLWCSPIGNDPGSALSAEENTVTEKKTIRKEFLPEHDRSGVPVVLTFEGTIYTPPQEVKMVDKEKWDTSTPEASYRGIVTANMRGDAEWITHGFAPSERARIQGLLRDKQTLARNTLIYEHIAKELLVQ